MVKGTMADIDPGQCPQKGQGQAGEESLCWSRPAAETLCTLILAHGAGAPMDSPFMNEMAERLVACGVAVVRFEFPYMAARRVDGTRRPPNSQRQLLDHWRQVYARVRQQVTGPLAIGGKSMGGRMASMLADELRADALICLGYPFHAAGKPEKTRVEHLAELRTPTLILQGERDALGSRDEVENYRLAATIRIEWLAAADHDLKPLKRSGFTHTQHLQRSAEAIAEFLVPATAGFFND
jgi:predicted alpha/beta-hydrolase family hydrolase